VILSVVLYVCEVRSVSHFEGGTQTEGFENSVLRKFGPRRYKDRSWRILYNDEISRLYSSPILVASYDTHGYGGTILIPQSPHGEILFFVCLISDMKYHTARNRNTIITTEHSHNFK
jgi:hypothetical protein